MEPSGHCPYLGLKQNRAIRFASPTSEHRCYVGGEPIDIPVDQSSYCLSQGHIHCPLYTGSMLGTTPVAPEPTFALPLAETPGLRGWMASLSPRDRSIYALMIGLLGVIAAIYIVLGLQSLLSGDSTATQPTPVATDAAAAVLPTAASAVTALPATPTALPTNVAPTAAPSPEPTANIIFPPTQVATSAPTEPAVTSEPSAAPTSTLAAAASTRTPPPATAAPTSAPATPTQAAVMSEESITLYFGDESGALLVPVQRLAQVEDGQVARAAVNELIVGPRESLQPLLLPTTRLLDLRIDDGTAIINFDRRPTGQGDVRGYQAVVLTLTQFTSIQRVQFQINGQNTGIGGTGPATRPILNPLNPDGLPATIGTTEFLPLYFPLKNGEYDVRIIRLVPKTTETARATINALLEGPGTFAYAVQEVIPVGTELRGISIGQSTRVITVDFTQPFASAVNREAATRNIVQSLTALPDVRGVQILVEGQPLADQWGEAYRNGFGRPVINPE